MSLPGVAVPGMFRRSPPDPGGVSPSELVSVGHSTLDRDQLAELLLGAGIAVVVDVRTAPGSRRNPQLGRESLRAWLPDRGIDYQWERDLGGFRRPAPDSPDTVWRNASFRGYAGHTRDPRFLAAMDRLIAQAVHRPTAIMCSEAVWWRCHRRIIADFAVLARGMRVRHLMPDGRLQPHVPTSGARLRGDGLLVYDGAADGPSVAAGE